MSALGARLRAIAHSLDEQQEGPFYRYPAGDFSTPSVPTQWTTGEYIVISNETTNQHVVSAIPRIAPTVKPTWQLEVAAILNIPVRPFSEVDLDSADAAVTWFASDVPLLLGNTGNYGVPP